MFVYNLVINAYLNAFEIFKTNSLREILIFDDNIIVAIVHRKEIKDRLTRIATYIIRKILKSALISAIIFMILKVSSIEVDKIDAFKIISWNKNLSSKFKIDKRMEENRI
ncbi:hypothetical protein R3W88_018823 [Solanum pinnatisectum]|uniref:Uncharacterized protein n=1 Tax=Solanum pinnatisectum TaxID=50273 RepID=A0AAV9KHI7_9SOLN|nr:hypothetical protein R3W88_018823 [Solanum pinnatisectum]